MKKLPIIVGIVGLVILLLWWGNKSYEQKPEEHHHHHDHEEESVFPFSEDAEAEANIEIKSATPQKLKVTLSKGGWIQVHPDRVAHVTAPFDSKAESVLKKVGDTVKEGDPLAILFSPNQLDNVKAYNATQEVEQLSLNEFERESQLFQLGLSTKQDLETKRSAYKQAQLAREHAENINGDHDNKLTLKAPFDGTIIERHLAVGEWVKPTETLFVVADLETLWVEFPLFPSEVDIVKPNSKITIKGQEATLLTVLPTLEGQLALKAIALVPNKGLTPGEYVDIDIIVREPETKVAVERTAIFDLEGKPHVFVKKEGGFEAREVTLGEEDPSYVEVVAGLDPDEKYASKNGFRVKADMGKEDVEHDD